MAMPVEKMVDVVLDQMFTEKNRSQLAKAHDVSVSDVRTLENSDYDAQIRQIAIQELVRLRLPTVEKKVKTIRAEVAAKLAAEAEATIAEAGK